MSSERFQKVSSIISSVRLVPLRGSRGTVKLHKPIIDTGDFIFDLEEMTIEMILYLIFDGRDVFLLSLCRIAACRFHYGLTTGTVGSLKIECALGAI